MDGWIYRLVFPFVGVRVPRLPWRLLDVTFLPSE